MIGLILIVASVSSGLLTAVNILTKARIKKNEEEKLKRSVLNVFSIPYEKETIIDTFGRTVEIREKNGQTYYRYMENGKISGIACEIKGPGFWGPISGLVALNDSLNFIKGIEILHQEETPGLGGRITESEFKDQFRGRPVRPEIKVDAITGATMTSKAFKELINKDVKSFRENYRK